MCIHLFAGFVNSRISNYLYTIVAIFCTLLFAKNWTLLFTSYTATDITRIGEPYNLIIGCDFAEFVWFPAGGSDDGPVMMISAKKTTDAAQDGVENRLLKPTIPVADEFFSNLAIDQMEEGVCSGSNLEGWEKLRASLLKYAYPPFTETDNVKGLLKLLNEVPPNIYWPLLAGLSAVPELFATIGPAIPILYLASLGITAQEPEVVGKSYLMMSSEIPKIQPFQRDWEIFIPRANANAALNAAKAYFKTYNIHLPLTGVFI